MSKESGSINALLDWARLGWSAQAGYPIQMPELVQCIFKCFFFYAHLFIRLPDECRGQVECRSKKLRPCKKECRARRERKRRQAEHKLREHKQTNLTHPMQPPEAERLPAILKVDSQNSRLIWHS